MLQSHRLTKQLQNTVMSTINQNSTKEHWDKKSQYST